MLPEKLRYFSFCPEIMKLSQDAFSNFIIYHNFMFFTPFTFPFFIRSKMLPKVWITMQRREKKGLYVSTYCSCCLVWFLMTSFSFHLKENEITERQLLFDLPPYPHALPDWLYSWTFLICSSDTKLEINFDWINSQLRGRSQNRNEWE